MENYKLWLGFQDLRVGDCHHPVAVFYRRHLKDPV